MKFKEVTIFGGTGLIGKYLLQILIDDPEIDSIDFVTRRPGDIDECYTSPKLANNHLGWKSDKTIMDMCKDYVSWSRKMNIIDI